MLCIGKERLTKFFNTENQRKRGVHRDIILFFFKGIWIYKQPVKF
jgi:hypothetical protein